MDKLVQRLIRDDSGQGMVEYGLILALVAIVVIIALRAIGSSVNNKFEQVNNALNN
ncbi:Flp family type IVb pilin [Desulforudis sp. 1088]|uniref:Flp family type IVb pilin n=1 Tax=unclassified Candidatus Desulforudis TaxID=2635950 RepID=UPI00349A1DFB